MPGVYPQTQEQRCWVHKIKHVQDKLPKSLYGKLKALLAEMYMSQTKEQAACPHNESDRAGVCHSAFRHEANERLWQSASDVGDGLEILLRGAEELTKAARL